MPTPVTTFYGVSHMFETRSLVTRARSQCVGLTGSCRAESQHGFVERCVVLWGRHGVKRRERPCHPGASHRRPAEFAAISGGPRGNAAADFDAWAVERRSFVEWYQCQRRGGSCDRGGSRRGSRTARRTATQRHGVCPSTTICAGATVIKGDDTWNGEEGSSERKLEKQGG